MDQRSKFPENARKDNLDLEDKKIVFFDGVCNLCNGFVDYVIRNDKKKQLFFCSLQSSTALDILAEFNEKPKGDLSTIYFYDQGAIYKRSSAILRINRYLGFPNWLLSYILLIVPPFIQNFFYDWIARNRYRILGKKDTCRLPSPDEAKQFLK